MEGTVNPASGERNSLTDLNAREHAGEPKHRDAHVASSLSSTGRSGVPSRPVAW